MLILVGDSRCLNWSYEQKLSDWVKLSVLTHLWWQFVLKILCSLVRTKSDYWDIIIRLHTSEMCLYVTRKGFTLEWKNNSRPGLYLFDTGQQSGANVKAIHIRGEGNHEFIACPKWGLCVL